MNTSKTIPVARLRVLATTDLHMHLLAYDYFADRADNSLGLCGLVDLIDALRAEHPQATLLCDNGDFLEGTPLADHIVGASGTLQIHPMIAAQNALGYDAITLGNHDLDFGLPFLRQALGQSHAAVVSANVTCTDTPPIASGFTIATRSLVCSDGKTRPIKIGITGFAPPQTQNTGPPGALVVCDIVESARKIVPSIKAAGADIIVALCHSGIANTQHQQMMENAAVPLAAVDGIDALVLGHTHELFPASARPRTNAVDPQAGTLHGKPAVMAGYYGTSLGLIDLAVAWNGAGWHVQNHEVRLIKPQTPPVPKSKRRTEIEQLATQPHTATLFKIRRPIAQTVVRIQNYFATVQPDLSLQLLASAMHDVVTSAMPDVPVLAAVSPFRHGGRNGLGQYIDIPPGDVTLRDAAAIFPFADGLCAVRRSGAQIKDWLERTASHYNTIAPHKTQQALLNQLSAGYNCDTLYGLTYDIDLSQPARYDPFGCVIDPDALRVHNIAMNGHAINDDDVFVVATNSFRANGGGGFAQVPPQDMLWQSDEDLRDIVVDALKSHGTFADGLTPVWRFKPIVGAVAQFQSAPQARLHLAGPIAHVGHACNGFDTYAITF
jgi:2',3'-cyclic-nucleotide 2'-phosphodiesterase/3'-nucleotidase